MQVDNEPAVASEEAANASVDGVNQGVDPRDQHARKRKRQSEASDSDDCKSAGPRKVRRVAKKVASATLQDSLRHHNDMIRQLAMSNYDSIMEGDNSQIQMYLHALVHDPATDTLINDKDWSWQPRFANDSELDEFYHLTDCFVGSPWAQNMTTCPEIQFRNGEFVTFNRGLYRASLSDSVPTAPANNVQSADSTQSQPLTLRLAPFLRRAVTSCIVFPQGPRAINPVENLMWATTRIYPYESSTGGDHQEIGKEEVIVGEDLKLPTPHPIYTSAVVQNSVAEFNQEIRGIEMALFQENGKSEFAQFKISPRTGDVVRYNRGLPIIYKTVSAIPCQWLHVVYPPIQPFIVTPSSSERRFMPPFQV